MKWLFYSIFGFLYALASQCVQAEILACTAGPSGSREQVVIQNSSFDEQGPAGIAQWLGIEHVHPGHYLFELDKHQPKSLPSSARISRVGDEDFGSLQQTVVIKSCWVGKRAVLTGFLRSAEVAEVGGALVLQANGGGGSILAWNHMNEQKVRGTTSWKSYSIDIAVPADTYFLRFGFMLEGPGTLWADDMKLEIIY